MFGRGGTQTRMTLALANPGSVVHDTFRAWHTERDAVEVQLQESLAALEAYQSHLDQWNEQLARDRARLQVDREEIERREAEITAAASAFDIERQELHEAKKANQTELAALRVEREAFLAERGALQGEQARLHTERDTFRQQQERLQQERAEVCAAREEARRAEEHVAVMRQQLLDEQNSLIDSRSRLESEWGDLRMARGKIEQEREEIRAERKQAESNRTAYEQGTSEAAGVMLIELNAARDKITSLTTNLLNRTDELRTIDKSRAEAATELEIMRERERELKAALYEHQQAAERERQLWKEELHELRASLQQRIEVKHEKSLVGVVLRESVSHVVGGVPSETVVVEAGKQATSPQNPVLGSIVQQFDKLRQQRASDRHGGNRPK